MIRVGLSGNRYSGKDHVCNLFEKMSIPIFDADVVLKFIINYNEGINRKIRIKYNNIFVNSYISTDLIKSKETVDGIIDYAEHELLLAYEKFHSKMSNKAHAYTIFKSSILFERGWNNLLDKSIVVFCPKVRRIERCQGLTEMKTSQISDFLSTELDEFEKNRLADFVIHNYEFAESVKTQIRKIDQDLIDIHFKNSHHGSNLR